MNEVKEILDFIRNTGLKAIELTEEYDEMYDIDKCRYLMANDTLPGDIATIMCVSYTQVEHMINEILSKPNGWNDIIKIRKELGIMSETNDELSARIDDLEMVQEMNTYNIKYLTERLKELGIDI